MTPAKLDKVLIHQLRGSNKLGWIQKKNMGNWMITLTDFLASFYLHRIWGNRHYEVSLENVKSEAAQTAGVSLL